MKREHLIGTGAECGESFGFSFTSNPPFWQNCLERTSDAITTLITIFSFAPSRSIKLLHRQKELEAELEAQRDEIRSANETMVKQNCELESTIETLKSIQTKLVQSDKMATVGLLTAGIAHELNNPINYVSCSVNPLQRDIDDLLSIIKKYDEVVKSTKLEDTFDEVDKLKNEMDFISMTNEINKLVKGIEDGANRSSHIVKGLRNFSRNGEDKRRHYNIHEGIDSSLVLLHNKLKNKITVRKDYGCFKDLECFPNKLNQVIMNALTNSIQAIKETGEICIQTLSNDLEVKIIIKDNGTGMTPEIKKQIFEPFYTSKEVGEGTGLGLYISFEIIKQHNGNIDVLSEPGKGTEFIISLPRTQSTQKSLD